MSAHLSNTEFMRAFQACELPSLSHEEHIRLAWVSLKEHTLLDSIRTLSCGLRAFAASKGAPGKFNETMTWAFILLINERMQRGNGGQTWNEFLSLNPDLCHGVEPLKILYSDTTLESELARNTFVLPDRISDAG